VPLRTVKMVSVEFKDVMVTGIIGGRISVCAVEPHDLYCASNVGCARLTGVRLAGHVALMARTHGKVLV